MGRAEIRILVACEESQAVCKAFRELGFTAFSCDIQECSGGHPEWHILGNVLPLLNGSCRFKTQSGDSYAELRQWDLIIAHPPCTDLAVSGAKHFAKKREDGRQQRSIEFFQQFTKADCPRIAIENPVGIMSTVWRKPDQIIHPWQFGDNYEKTTCLWLKGLPKLVPEVNDKPELEYTVIHSKDGKIRRLPKWYSDAAGNSKLRSKTFPGIARAMAEQWGRVCVIDSFISFE